MKIIKHKNISDAYQYVCPVCSKESMFFLIEPTTETFPLVCRCCDIKIILEFDFKLNTVELNSIIYSFDYFNDHFKRIFYRKSDTEVHLLFKENRTEIHTKMFDSYSAKYPEKINLPLIQILPIADMYKKIKTYMAYL